MCHEHTNEELANILDTMADLFTWKRRARLAEAATVLRSPSREWRQPSALDLPRENGFMPPAHLPASEGGRTG